MLTFLSTRWVVPLLAVLVVVSVCFAQVGHAVHDAHAPDAGCSCPVGDGAAANDDHGGDPADSLDSSLVTTLFVPHPPAKPHTLKLEVGRLPFPYGDIPPPIPISL